MTCPCNFRRLFAAVLSAAVFCLLPGESARGQAPRLRGADARKIAAANGWVARSEKDEKVFEIQEVRGGRPFYYITRNINAAASVSTNKVWPGGSAGLALNGSGVTLGIWDGGGVRLTHQELTGRAVQVDANEIEGLIDHATHVAGTMAATGVQAAAHGMGVMTRLNCSDWNNDYEEMATAASNGLRASNHSYGYGTGWELFYLGGNDFIWVWFGDVTISTVEDAYFGAYSFASEDWDRLASLFPNYLICVAAGNDRNDVGPLPGEQYYFFDPNVGDFVLSTVPRNSDGTPNGFDSISFAGIGKNVLTVGATKDVPGGYTAPGGVVMTSFSSWGPADDGRIKPDLSGNGYELYSTSAGGNTAYLTLSGTSMATPNVTGSLGLLIQHWRNTHSGAADMRSSTLKGVAIHTSDECGTNAGPDYSFGWGLLNTAAAAAAITADVNQPQTISEGTLGSGQTYELYMSVSGGPSNVRATLCWIDPPFNSPPVPTLDSPTPALINDLDLRIRPVAGGADLTPWKLSAASPSAAATRGDNTVDNVERIDADALPPGDYIVRITNKGQLQGGNQPFSLIVTGATLLSTEDCNTNKIIDALDVQHGISPDCNTNARPDDCTVELMADDCDTNRSLDRCEITFGLRPDCNTNQRLDFCSVDFGPFDCNTNRTPDACEIAAHSTPDCDTNGRPDVCPADLVKNDCNTNATPDRCEIRFGPETDCNTNATPDRCDISRGTADCDTNALPDLCQSDTDGDGAINPCDACPDDPSRFRPNVCGCEIPDTDSDNDGTPDCVDGCPADPFKSQPGDCGCGVSDADRDGDGVKDCTDGCPDNPTLTAPHICGCQFTLEECQGIIGCPPDLTLFASGPEGVRVDFSPIQSITSAPDIETFSSHQSGSLFPVGLTIVNMWITRPFSGEAVVCQFQILVLTPPQGASPLNAAGTGPAAPADSPLGGPLGALLGTSGLCGMTGMGGIALMALAAPLLLSRRRMPRRK